MFVELKLSSNACFDQPQADKSIMTVTHGYKTKSKQKKKKQIVAVNNIIGRVEGYFKKPHPLVHHDSFCLTHSAHLELKYSCSILLQCLKHLADCYSIRQEKKRKGGKKHLFLILFFFFQKSFLLHL